SCQHDHGSCSVASFVLPHIIIFFYIYISYTSIFLLFFFFFNDPATTEIYTLSLHDALPIYLLRPAAAGAVVRDVRGRAHARGDRSEEHTSELQSRFDLVCRLLLEKKKKKLHTKIYKLTIIKTNELCITTIIASTQ